MPIYQYERFLGINYKQLRLLCDWVLQINYEHGEHSVFCDTIKRKRDKIAHGEKIYPDLRDCEDLHGKTIEFLEALTDALRNNAAV